MRPHGRAKVDRFNPSAFGVCDACGFLYNLKDLHFQKEWYGARIQNTNMLKCYHCLDRPQEQHRVIHLPADPVPVRNPRIERYLSLNDPQTTIGFGSDPVFGTMTQGAGLRAAFDFNPTKPFGLCAATYISINGDNTIGRHWLGFTEGNQGVAAKRITVYAPLNGRFFGEGSTPWRFEGSNDGVTFTTITSGTTSGIIGEIIDVVFPSGGLYLYHRFVLTGNGIHSVSIAMLNIYQELTSPSFATPIPPTPIVLPVITSLSPTTGPIGTSVTISGSNFTGTTSVTFGGISATFTVVNDTTITTTAPSGSGAAAVMVTTTAGISNSATFTYALPVIASLSPNTGLAGITVTISGSAFTGATAVTFAGTPASFSFINDTTITTIVPAGTGAELVVVTTPVGFSNSITFTYTAAVITGTPLGLLLALTWNPTSTVIYPTQPVLSLVSATTTAIFTIDIDNTIGAGDSVELQVQVTGGSFTSLVSDTVHTITSGEDAANQINLSVGLPNGSYDARARVTDTVGTGLTSAWSNTVVNFTISGVVSYIPTYYFLGF